jgi:adenylate cyclase
VTRRLTRDELAVETRTTSSRIDELVAIGALHPDTDGAFTSVDVQRARIVDAYEAGGIGLELLALAIARRWTTFDHVEDLYPDPAPRSGRSFAEFREAIGPRGARLDSLLAAFGLPVPDPDSRLTTDDERVLEAFAERWDVSSDPTVPIRAARLVGEAMRRTVDGWLGLFAEQVSRPLEDRTRTVDEVAPLVLTPARRIVEQVPELLVWLFERHFEAGMNALNTSAMETGLAREGLLPDRPVHPQAIAFVDLAGYTRLTQEHGDELAARSAARLAELAGAAARPHGGHLVKLLGDGAMLHFPDARPSVGAVLGLVDAIADDGLPPAHGGVSAGPLVGRDGDFFGHTVNLAARLAGRAGPGQVLVTQSVVDAFESGPAGIRFESLGNVALRNVVQPVAVFEAVRDRD